MDDKDSQRKIAIKYKMINELNKLQVHMLDKKKIAKIMKQFQFNQRQNLLLEQINKKFTAEEMKKIEELNLSVTINQNVDKQIVERMT
jgi:hypothetical protein